MVTSWNNVVRCSFLYSMMTSSNGNIFRVTGPLCGECIGPGEFPAQRPVTRSFEVFFDLRLNKRLSKQSWGWWFETQSCSLWRQCNAVNDVMFECLARSSMVVLMTAASCLDKDPHTNGYKNRTWRKLYKSLDTNVSVSIHVENLIILMNKCIWILNL